jgi:peptidoglycan-associated lipoprotein
MRTLSIEAKQLITSSLLAGLLVVAGCAKKATPPPQAPPPPPAAPSASLSANPSTIERGQSARLSWNTQNATDVSIEGLGKVDPNGSQEVSPTESTTYRLTATGPGGTQDASARITVNVPPPPPATTEAEPSLSDSQWVTANLKDVFFDYDSAAIRPDAQAVVAANAKALGQRQNLNITIEGHADERGSTEYNLALGDERANAVKSALVAAGVNASRINVISYGKEKPVCTESNEACWQQNRRGHFVAR